ncbi:fimbrial protein [Burkholderia ambifaria]|uniref:Fimbrial protein n=1 Tax=Burkholderia ambifaria MEX-5 TaxID=396597 RepID=B1TG19_9BURK|nr:fimbrial protein [Burkholderia ambifaria]EDT37488.1 Fimbrial protein [Burkholderia ambifaria MEX-5]
MPSGIAALLAIVLPMMLAPSHARAATINAFGNQRIAVPSTTPVGTVVSRDYYTPRELCGSDTCEITSTIFYPKGSLLGASDGPDIETRVAGLSTRILYDGVPATASTRTTVHNRVEVQLFRDSRTPKNGSLKPFIFNMYFIVNYKAGLLSEPTSVYLAADTVFIAGTCMVPSQTVVLPSVSPANFNGIGSTAGTKPFMLQFLDCPAGFNKIGYQFMPLDGRIPGLPGTLALRPDSTASGVGIQLFNVQQAEYAPLGQSRPTPYNGQAGSYTLPFTASYVQTGPVIRSGSVRADAVVLLDYQ